MTEVHTSVIIMFTGLQASLQHKVSLKFVSDRVIGSRRTCGIPHQGQWPCFGLVTSTRTRAAVVLGCT